MIDPRQYQVSNPMMQPGKFARLLEQERHLDHVHVSFDGKSSWATFSPTIDKVIVITDLHGRTSYIGRASSGVIKTSYKELVESGDLYPNPLAKWDVGEMRRLLVGEWTDLPDNERSHSAAQMVAVYEQSYMDLITGGATCVDREGNQVEPLVYDTSPVSMAKRADTSIEDALHKTAPDLPRESTGPTIGGSMFRVDEALQDSAHKHVDDLKPASIVWGHGTKIGSANDIRRLDRYRDRPKR